MIHLDFETFSELDVRHVGAFKYAEHPSTEVLIMCWAFDDGPVRTWTQGDPPPIELLRRAASGEPVGAHFAQFEYCVWNQVLPKHIPGVRPLRAKQLQCTAARAAMCSLPRSLEKAGAALNLRIQKDKRGKYLIGMFSGLRKPTKKDPRDRIYPDDAPELFNEFKSYCRTDVETERELDKCLPQLPPFEQIAYQHDLKMNKRGIPLNIKMIKKAARVVAELERRAKRRVNDLTNGINPTQRDRLLDWLASQGVEMKDLQAATVRSLLLSDQKLSPKVRELLELRVEASRVSTKKLISMMRVACDDWRARGMLLYYAAHTGRAGGRLIQPQNMIRGLPDTKEQIRLMKMVFRLFEAGADADTFEWVFDTPLTSIAQCMRGFIAAEVGKRIMVVDYSQIEARLLVWLADEESAIQEYVEFDQGKGHDRYVLMAAFLWQIKPEDVTKDQRRIAKNLVLGCGFGLGDKKFIVYCEKQDVIIDEPMSKRAVRAFREKHPSVVAYWRDVENCAIRAVRRKGERIFLRNVSFHCDLKGDWLTIRLPSGRDIYYPKPQIKTTEKFGMPSVQLTFMDEKKGQWVRVSTYGGRLVENIVQGTARDVLNVGCINAERGNYPIILIVHDELLCEIKIGKGSIDELKKLACKMDPWIGKCPIAADGFETPWYRKG